MALLAAGNGQLPLEGPEAAFRYTKEEVCFVLVPLYPQSMEVV